MKKKIKNASRNRLILFGSISIFIIILFIYTCISYGIKLKELENNKISLYENIDKLENEAEILQNEITKLKDPAYLARYARENYMYSKDGEYIIKIDSLNKEKTKDPEENNNLGNILPWILVFIPLMIFIVMKKIFKK